MQPYSLRCSTSGILALVYGRAVVGAYQRLLRRPEKVR